MSITASAPGKLILLGEYAVLAGAPALVAAVDRRATAVIEPHANGDIRVMASDLGIDTHAVIGARGEVTWAGGDETAARLHLVASALSAAHRDAAAGESGVIPSSVEPGGYALTLSTRAFFDAPGTKLGLGSSAALTVALTGALRRHLGLSPPALSDLVHLHRGMQGGHGSGADVAAAFTGGVIAYTRGVGDSSTSEPGAQAVALPAGLHWCCVFTGRSASTPHMLARFRDWRHDHAAS